MIRPVLALAALAALLGTAAAGAAEYRPLGTTYHVQPTTPGCDDPKMLSDMVGRYGWAHARTWGTGFQIVRFDGIRETRLALGPGLIERRYCQAVSLLNTGEQPKVYYMIESQQGFVGLGSRVEFCVQGQDYWHVHDGYCRTVRPQ